MENNLYYTPTLQDLHYGFEFEYKSKDDNWIKVTLDTWNRPSKENHLKYFTEYDLLRTLNHQDQACKYADLTCIRVKFLDQSDIESLGWKYVKDLCPGDGGQRWFDLFLKDETTLCFGTKLIIRINSKVCSYGLLDNMKPGDIVFSGDIKNKSELIKLQQQLNIK
jgi:hypothetical protein